MSRPPTPAIVGTQNDPKVQDHLADIAATLRDCGIEHVSASEVCRLYHTGIAKRVYGLKGRGQVFAIPRSTLIPAIMRFCQKVFEPLRAKLGQPIFIKNFYRPPKYNAAVNGATRSRHQWGDGADLYPVKSPDSDIRDLRDAAIDIWLDNPRDPIGIGLYAGNVHLDYGYRRRSWGSRRSEIAAEKAERAAQADVEDYDKGGVEPGAIT